MPRRPRLSGKDVIRKLERGGYHFVRQRGSHIRLEHESRKPTGVPLHDSDDAKNDEKDEKNIPSHANLLLH